MRIIDRGAERFIPGRGGPGAPAVLVIDSPEHPLPVDEVVSGLESNVVTVPVLEWGRWLTPWRAPGLRPGSPAFGGGAPRLMAELRSDFIPDSLARLGLVPSGLGVCGYSLGGLFALYAFTCDPAVRACGCLSGSVWYEGWVDYLRGCRMEGEGRYAFLSLGRRESRAGAPAVRCVRDNMEACAEILSSAGCGVDLSLGPGNHMQHLEERLRAGLIAVDGFLAPGRPASERG